MIATGPELPKPVMVSTGQPLKAMRTCRAFYVRALSEMSDIRVQIMG